MKAWTCVVIGGGYAGIHAVKSIRKAYKDEAGQHPLRLVLIDRNPYHLRKVLLFQPAARDEEVRIPLASLFPEGVELIQATVTKIEAGAKSVLYQDKEGQEHAMDYEALVIACGSIVKQPDPAQGGLALTGLASAQSIRQRWRANLEQAAGESSGEVRQRLMTIAIAGAGISGIETAAELAHFVRKDARRLGLDPDSVGILLYNTAQRLFPEGPAKVGQKLESALIDRGVTVLHGSRVSREEGGILTLSDGRTAQVGLCIWTLGLQPHPMLKQLGLPIDPEGYVAVDESYRVAGTQGIYSIGDCARIIDKATGRADGKTCKEAIAQASRLAKVIAADRAGRPAPVHKGFMDFFCFGLGPEQGMAWTSMWGADIFMTGKLGWRLRKFTWDSASLIR